MKLMVENVEALKLSLLEACLLAPGGATFPLASLET